MEDIKPPNSSGTTVEWLGRIAARLWRSILFFLEIVGIRREESVDQAAQVSRLKLYHAEFRKLLSANNSFLETMADLEHKLLKREYIERSFIKRKVMRAIADVHAMVESLNVISEGRYPDLRKVLEQNTAALTTLAEDSSRPAPAELVMEMSAIYRNHDDLAGGKMANLGEIRNVLRLPTPDGFVVTTEGFRLVIEEGGIRSWVQDRHMELLSSGDVAGISRDILEMIEKVEIPLALREAIIDLYDRLARRTGSSPSLAVRSSALGEDTDFSFAGQFLSLLNVGREGLLSAYLRVVASLYSPEAIHYQLLHGILGESAEMAVGCITMVDALASGVVFSRDPNQPDSGQVLIQAIRGLGVPLVEGKTSPESIFVSRENRGCVITRIPSQQKSRLVSSPDAGLKEETLRPEEVGQDCLTDDEARQLAQWALKLETHFGGPQDIEWAMDKNRQIILLQSRPLRLFRHIVQTDRPVDGFPVLVRGGEVACPGVGSGPAVHIAEDGDMDNFPIGGVLVARRSSPKFIRLMSRARAIVTDFGSTTGHMASLAREFRVPTLLNTRIATREIPPGAIVTVDANNGFVYEGKLSIREGKEGEKWGVDSGIQKPPSPRFQLLERVIELVAPLYLTDPRSPEFTADKCSTLHDLARYIHEKSYKEMFMMGKRVGDLRASSYCLDVFLPIDLYLIDLGGGIKGMPRGRRVKPSQIASVPLAALLRGMLHEKIPRFGPRPMDFRGLFSIMMRHAVNSPEAESTFRDPCYAIISDNYLNYTARVGYHFSVVDTYCGNTPNKNYISLTFRGGAADYTRRGRRARAIAGILREYDLSVEVSRDLVNARLGKATREETVGHLEMIGSLFQFFRQMDVAMTNEDSVQMLKDAFLRGDYDLEKLMGR
ncbi:MAG: phosphoenolpyruvate synthase [Deltaproteobacteria bacterium]|nr:MAG: phosphoenolpyruvate synthase [Deltaproteobacteria bacterium]